MSNAEAFWDRMAAGYAKRPVKDMDAYNRTLERTRSYLSRDDKVLEIGCGTGTTALRLADGVKHITATDISSNMIEIARGKARDQAAENVSFVQATLSDHTFEKASFDAVLAFNIFHLLRDIPAATREIRELLAPQGVFISKTPCLAEKNNLLRVPIFLMKTLGFAPYVKFLKVRELEDLIAAEGFQVIETGDYPVSPQSRFVVARKI